MQIIFSAATILSTIVILFLFTLLLRKLNYDLKGFECFLAFIPGVFLRSNLIDMSLDIFSHLAPLFAVLLLYYYILRGVKRNEYISLMLLLVYFLFSFAASVINNFYEGIVGVGVSIYLRTINFGIIYCILIINLVKLIVNTAKKHNKKQIDAVPIVPNITCDRTIPKKITVLYKVFVAVSAVIGVFLFPLAFKLTSRFPDAYAKNEADFKEIALGTANKTAIFIWPILIAYIALLIAMIVKKTDRRKIYYPLSVFVFTVFALCLGIVYYDMLVMWYLILFFPEIITLFSVAIILGNNLDTDRIKKKTAVIALSFTLLLTFAMPVMYILTLFDMLNA